MINLFNLETEQSVLGGVLIDPKRLDDVTDLLTENDFYDVRHREIYRAFLELQHQGHPVDLVTVSEHLNNSGKLEMSGGMSYLYSVGSNTPTAANITAYARGVAQKATERRLLGAAHEITEAVHSDLKLDEKVNIAQGAVLNLSTDSEEEATHASDEMKGLVSQWQVRLENQGMLTGLPTGFTALDNRTQGLQKTDLIIVAGRPSMGKTTFAMNLVEKLALVEQKNVLVFSLEMSKSQLLEKLVSSYGKIPMKKLKDGSAFLDAEYDCRLHPAAQKIKESGLYIDDRASLSINQMRSTARKLNRRASLSMVVVDYIQLATANTSSRELEISAISRGLKAMAKELDIPVIALSQLSRKCEERNDKRPLCSDLRESGSIEQDADMVMFLYRDEVYNEDSEHSGIAELITRKYRHGEIGTDYLDSKLNISKFDNRMSAVPQYEYKKDSTFDY